MPKHIFVKFGDTVKGEAEDKDHDGWCEVSDVTWGLSSTASPTAKDQDERARGKIDIVKISKLMDRASIALSNICWKGQHIPEVVIESFHSAGGEIGGVKYLELRLQNVVIKKFELKLQESTAEPPGEDIELVFSYIKMTYYPRDKSSGMALGQMSVEMDTAAEQN